MKCNGSMNRIFRLVWSDVLNGWVAVAEQTRGRGKGSSRKLIAAAVASLANLTGMLGSDAIAAPAGAQVMAGAGSVAQAGATTTVTQTSPNLALQWKSFNIAAQETVNFIQPTAASIAVNRITDINGSQILGRLTANGQVYLINPNGVLFGQGAQVNVGGLVASTLDLNEAKSTDASKSFSGSSSASVVNQGAITAANYVALLGNQVSNQGVITAQLGTVALGAGSAATLNFSGNRLVNMHVDQSLLSSLAENSGLIQADGGQVIMTAGARDALLASTVNNTGVIQAHSMEEHDGVIMLVGGMAAGNVHVVGTLDASAPVRGNGGFIETSAAHVHIADSAKVTTAAAKGRSGNWLIDPFDFTVAATGGDMSGSALSSMLNSGSINISNIQGSKTGLGNITINDGVSWSENTLTLSAFGSINIYSTLNGGASGKLVLQYAQGDVAGQINYVNGSINLSAGKNYSTKYGSDLQTDYNVITHLGVASDATTAPATLTLQSMAAATGLNNSYVLGANIDASATAISNYSANNGGFIPIGSKSKTFGGTLDGLGHIVSGLTINRPFSLYVGLFGYIGGAGTVQNIGLITPSVNGNKGVGALAGFNFGNIFNSYVSLGSVTGTSNPGAPGSLVGGLVGFNGSLVSDSYSTVNVAAALSTPSSPGGNTFGGLVGSNLVGTVTNSYATGSVNGGNGTAVGGLVGDNTNGTITNSYATGLVTGATKLGGLVGSSLSNSTVTGGYWNIDTTKQATSDGAGTGLSNAAMMTSGNFTGPVPNWDFSNVWVNYDTHTYPLLRYFMLPLSVTASSAPKVYDGQAYSGVNSASYSTYANYSTATPNNVFGSLTFNDSLAGTASSAKNAGSYVVTPAGLFSNQQGYIIGYVSGTLTVSPKALSATATAVNKVYDGTVVAAAPILTIDKTGFVTGETVTATATGSFNTKDVATANLVTVNSTLLANGTGGGLASNYSLAIGETASANITAKALSATASASNKTYDGNSAASPMLTPVSTGFVNNETVLATGTGTFNTKDVATANLVTVNSTSLTDGINGGMAANYSLAAGETASAKITAKVLTATAKANNKVYDGDATAVPLLTISTAGFVNNETVTVTATGSFNTKDVATANLVTVNSTTLTNGANGGVGSNYYLARGETASANITAKALSATASAPNKTYDGSSAATPILVIDASGFIGGETVKASAIGTFNTKDVVSANLVTVTSTMLSDNTGGGLASNYSLASGETAAAHIIAKALSATASASNKVYDGSATAAPMLVIASAGFVNGETVTATATGSFNSKDVLIANTVTVNSTTLANGANGGMASNYSLATGETASANITAKALSATASASNKTYDGSSAATPAPILTIPSADFVSGETVTATATGSFNSKDVATANLVTVNSTTLANGTGGGLASNYSLASGQTASANIRARALSATASASNKTYDGSTVAASVLVIASAGLVNGETVTATATGSFNSKDVSSANTVTVNSTTLANGVNGGMASNYSLASGETASANITAKALSATASAANKTYDGSMIAAPMLAINSAGFVNGETVTAIATGTFNAKDVATANLVTVNSTTLTNGANGGLASNYSLASGETASAQITARALSAIASASNKTYDGSTVAAPMLAIDSTGFVNGETVTATAAGTFNSKDVATANLVTVNSASLADGMGGGLASNYRLIAGETASANITAKALSATASASNKTYDGSTAATPAPTLTIASAGFVNGETVTATATGSFNTKDVATANLVTVNSTTLLNGTNGGLASNYSLASGETANANITAKALSATANASNKTYDGSTIAAPTLAINSAGFVNGETVTATATGTFNSKDVLTANLVTVNSLTLANGVNGGLAGNYSLVNGETVNASITAKALSATASASNKTYDGSTVAAPMLTIASAGFVNGETVTTTATGTFNTKDVSTANLVMVNSTTLSNGVGGGLASNYSLASGETASANITAKALSAMASATSKTYDGSTVAAPVLVIASAAFINGETVTATATGSFNTKDVATANLVTVNSTTLANGANGGLASNYSLVSGETASANITAKALSAATSAFNKTYDGSRNAAPTLAIDSAGFVNGETVTATATATFNAKDVLTANLVTVNSLTLANGANGGMASNYSLVTGETVNANITAKALSATASATNKTYDGSTVAAPTLAIVSAGFVNGETVTATATGAFNTKDVSTANLVTVNSTTLSNGVGGGLASNYSLASGETASANITAKALSATANATNKTYDGSTVAAPVLTIASAGFVNGESVTASATGNFNSKDVLTANVVTVNSTTLANGANGGLASNYSLASGEMASANITAKALSAVASASNKTYDGSRNAAPTLSIDAAGFVNGETVTATATGTFNAKDVSTANLVTVNSTTLANGVNGGLVSNYSLASGETAAANITAKALSAVASASNKTYDGNRNAAPTLAIDSAGFINGETVTATATGSFNTKDVLTANLVVVNSTTLVNGANGGLASNYSLGSSEAASANITAKALSAAAGASNKTYDGSTVAAPILAIDSAGFVNGETVTASATGTFNTKDVLTANLVTVNSTTLANGANGGLASNYSLVTGETVNASITAKALSAAASASNKTYDGSTVAVPVLVIASAGLVNGETVTATATGNFNTKDVATADRVTVNSTTLLNGTSGGLASNYSLASGQTASANITAKALNATASASNKTYDGSTVATPAPTLTIASAGFVNGETVTATGTGNFNSKDVATAKVVTVNSATLANGTGGGLANNYSLSPGQTANANITAKALIANLGTFSKTYDGNTSATPTFNIDPRGLIGIETVMATGSASLNSKDVSTAKQIIATAIRLLDGTNGGLASNYSVLGGQSAAATITAKQLTASLTTATKVYDGTTSVTPTLTITKGLVGVETVTAAGMASLNSKDVDTARFATLNSTALLDGANGGKASNYNLAPGQTAPATLTPAVLTYTATPASFFVGQTPGNLFGSVSGLVAGDTLAGSTTGTLKWTTTANSTHPAGIYPINGSGLISVDYSTVNLPGNATALTLRSGISPSVFSNVTSVDELSRSTITKVMIVQSGKSLGVDITIGSAPLVFDSPSAGAASVSDVSVLGRDMVDTTVVNSRISVIKTGAILTVIEASKDGELIEKNLNVIE